jgi:hypothetical protein
VTSGAVDIGLPAASVVHVGLPYISRITTLPLNAGAQGGASIGRPKRINEVRLLLHETGGATVGTYVDGASVGNEEVIAFTTPFSTAAAPVLFSGVKRWTVDGGWDLYGQVTVRSTGPAPMTVQGIVFEGATVG